MERTRGSTEGEPDLRYNIHLLHGHSGLALSQVLLFSLSAIGLDGIDIIYDITHKGWVSEGCLYQLLQQCCVNNNHETSVSYN